MEKLEKLMDRQTQSRLASINIIYFKKEFFISTKVLPKELAFYVVRKRIHIFRNQKSKLTIYYER